MGPGAEGRYYPGVNLSLLTIVFLPSAAGASYYFGGPVLGSVWMGVILLTCLTVYAVARRAKS